MKISCGILPYRIVNNELQVFLIHPGGPFFSRKDDGFWGISKGEANKDEELIDCAIREFKEETGIDFTQRKNDLVAIGSIIQTNNKQVYAWAIKDELTNLVDSNGFADLRAVSNKIEIKLGIKIFESPEIDKGQFFNVESAKQKMNKMQSEFLEKIPA